MTQYTKEEIKELQMASTAELMRALNAVMNAAYNLLGPSEAAREMTKEIERRLQFAEDNGVREE